MSNTMPYIRAISRDSPWFQGIIDDSLELGTIVLAEFEFGPHYAIVWQRDGDDHVDLLVVSSKPRLAERSDCVKIEPSGYVPWKKDSYVKCEEQIRLPIEKIEKVYGGVFLPNIFIEEIEEMVEGR